MSRESFEHLKKHPNQSYLSERYLGTELLRTKKEERTLEQNIAFIAVWMCFGENIYDTNTYYSPPLENIWTINTMYSEKSAIGPPVVYDFERFRPDGQCGPSDLVPAKLTDWSEFKESGEITEVTWKEGDLWVWHEGKRVKASDHHTWYEVFAADGRSWILDLAAYQYRYPGAQIRVVMQGQNGHKTDDYAISGVNRQIFNTKDDQPTIIENAHTLYYDANPKFVMPIGEFNWENGEGRPEQIIGARGISSMMTLGDIREGVRINGGEDYPEGYSFEAELVGEERHMEQYASSGISIETATRLVRESSEEKIELSVEGLGMVIKDLVEKSDSEKLAVWAVDCAERSLHCFEEETGNFESRSVIADLRKRLETGAGLPYQLLEKPIMVASRFDAFYPDMGHNARMAIHALEGAVCAVRDIDKLDIDMGGTGVIANAAAQSAAMALDFSALDKNSKPIPISERHWQYLRIHELTYPFISTEDEPEYT